MNDEGSLIASDPLSARCEMSRTDTVAAASVSEISCVVYQSGCSWISPTYVRRHRIKKYLNLTHTVLTPVGLMHTSSKHSRSHTEFGISCVIHSYTNTRFLMHWIFCLLVTLSHTQKVRGKMGCTSKSHQAWHWRLLDAEEDRLLFMESVEFMTRWWSLMLGLHHERRH